MVEGRSPEFFATGTGQEQERERFLTGQSTLLIGQDTARHIYCNKSEFNYTVSSISRLRRLKVSRRP
jgi:hypothetical protein